MIAERKDVVVAAAFKAAIKRAASLARLTRTTCHPTVAATRERSRSVLTVLTAPTLAIGTRKHVPCPFRIPYSVAES